MLAINGDLFLLGSLNKYSSFPRDEHLFKLAEIKFKEELDSLLEVRVEIKVGNIQVWITVGTANGMHRYSLSIIRKADKTLFLI